MSGTTRVPTSSVDVYADEVYSPRTGRDLVFVPRFLTTVPPGAAELDQVGALAVAVAGGAFGIDRDRSLAAG